MKMTKIYTATYGIVEVSTLINKTPKGYRVKGGMFPYEHVVFRFRQFSGWVTDERMYYQQRAFTSKIEAETFAMKQVISMENYYKLKLSIISKLRRALTIT